MCTFLFANDYKTLKITSPLHRVTESEKGTKLCQNIRMICCVKDFPNDIECSELGNLVDTL